MIRRCVCSLMPLVEARSLFFDELGRPLPQLTAPLPRVLEALGEHYAPSSGGEAFVEAAMRHLVQLDRSDADSRAIAAWGQAAGGGGGRMVLELMRAYPHSPAVRALSCRCLANLSQLSAPSRGEDGLAESLVREGAVEQALGTAAMAARLSGRGRCWAALAVLNLICLSRTGLARAAASGAEAVLSDLLCTVMEAREGDVEGDLASPTQEKHGARQGADAGLPTLGREVCIALDAALGALTAVLAAEAPENAQGISYNHEKVGYATVDAIARALLLSSTLLCHIARSDGDPCASFPPQRGIVVSFPDLSPRRQTAIITLMPLLHKAWMALCAICGRVENVPMVCESLYAASSASEGGESGEGNVGPVGPPSGNSASRRHVTSSLSRVVEAARFLVSELEGLQGVGDVELSSLQLELSQSVMECVDHLTATRTDVPTRGLPNSTTTTASDAVGRENDSDGVSKFLPIPAVLSVMEVCASGDLSCMALSTAVRLHADLRSTPHSEGAGLPGSDVACLQPWDVDGFRLLCRAISVLNHLAGANDEIARSANAVAALQVILRGTLDGMDAVACRYARGDGAPEGDLAELFRTAAESPEAGDEVDGEGRPSGLQTTPGEGKEPPLRLFFTQQMELVARIYAVLSSVLQAPSGVCTLVELNAMDTVKEVQRCLHEVYAPAMRRAIKGEEADATAPTFPKETDHATTVVEVDAHSVPHATWKLSRLEDSVHHLVEFGDRLVSHFQMVSKAPSGGADPVKRDT